MIDEDGGAGANTSSETTNTSGKPDSNPRSSLHQELQVKSKAALQRRKDMLDRFLAAPRENQRKLVEDKWAQLCYELVDRAHRYAGTASDKDFGKLSQLVTSAAIAKDKVFHREDAKQPGNIVFNLFGNVGLDAIKKMLQPSAPIVINAKEIPHEVVPIQPTV